MEESSIIMRVTQLLMAGALFLALFYAVQLFAIKNFNVKANRILAFFFAQFAFLMGFLMAAQSGLTDLATNLFWVFTPVILCMAPTLYLYLKSLSHQDGISRKDLLHYLPPGLVLLVTLPSFIAARTMESGTDIHHLMVDIMGDTVIGGAAVGWPIQNIVYLIISALLYSRHKRNVGEIFSFAEGINLRWIRISVIGYFLFFVGVVGSQLLGGDSLGTFHGQVYLERAGDLNRITLRVRDDEGKHLHFVTTDATGTFTVDSLPSGPKYSVVPLHKDSAAMTLLALDDRAEIVQEIAWAEEGFPVSNDSVVYTTDWYSELMNSLLYVVILAYLVYVGYNGNRQIDIYYGLKSGDEDELLDGTELTPISPKPNAAAATVARQDTLGDGQAKEKYAGSSLKDDEKALAIKARLLEFMETEKPYTDTNLTIFDVARSLQINNKYISQVINNRLNKNFMSFINEYRVEEAKKLLLDPERSNYTIEGLAEMSGFKSKSTFNAAFKKLTGQTPSQFRKAQRQEA